MKPSTSTIDNPYSAPDVDDGVSSVRLNRWQRFVSFIAFFVGSIIGLNVGSAISQGVASTIQRSAYNIPDAIWSFLGWAACCVGFTCPWFIGRRFLFKTTRPTPLASFIAAIQAAVLFYLVAQQVGRPGFLNFIPSQMHSSVFALLALIFGSAAVECEIILTRLFSRATSNGVEWTNNGE